MSGKVHIVIPDSHATPGDSNRRYDLLGELIAEVKPDTVVDIGDWFDMASLCSYDKGTKGFEGRRYKADIEVGVEAQDRLKTILRRGKRKLPRFVRVLGNHEHRIMKAIDRDPVLEGTIGLEDLQSKEYGWEQYDFGDVVNIDGVNYSHYFASGLMGRPVSSARQLVMKQGSSCTMGHTHTFDYETVNNVEGKTRHGLFCGVFQEKTPGFARNTAHLWNRGVVIKRDVKAGNYDLEWVSMERLIKLYG